MQGGHGYYGGGGGSPPQGYGYGSYGYGGYGHDAGYYSNIYPSVPDDPLAGQKAHEFPAPPTNELQFQPSETCPKNYVIFDQTYAESRVMFHPSLAHKFEAGKSTYRDKDYDDSCSVRHKEDTDEIDALLSSEEDDVVSTGRTPGYRDGSSPDSCSSGKKKKKERMKKMVRTLKGIIPGGNQMDTPAVLDEAVKYLKSLKVEVKKLGVRGSDS
ncbi:hypothetical protein ACQ4PT_060812 [Festuca glaucescens]